MTTLRISRHLARAAGLALIFTIAACGGGGGAANPLANPHITITWPERTRDGDVPAPGSAMSASVYIEGVNTGANCTVYITRDDNTSLHTGQYPIGQPWPQVPAHVTSTFFSEPNQGGSIVGIATADVDPSGGDFNIINISLVNSVKSVKVIEPTSVAVSSTPTQLLFEADGNGATVIPVTPGSAHWTLVSGSGGNLTPDGKLTANQAGTFVVKVTVDGVTSPDKTVTATEGGGSQITFEDLGSADAKECTGTGAGGNGIVAGYYMPMAQPLQSHAAFWVDGVRTDAHPGTNYSSIINATSGTNAVGNISPTGSSFQAGTFSMGGFVNLDPTGNYSDAFGVDGGTQVGMKGRKACMWTGTPQSYVDLHPADWRESYATGVSGSNIVGWVTSVPMIPGSKAVIWTGANHQLTYLDPPGFRGSKALAISGNTIGGYYTINDGLSSMHACIWPTVSTNVIDLNPSFAGGSNVTGLSGTVAVGWYALPNNDQIYRACIWNGTSSSFIDLNALLGSNYPGGSQALSIAPELGGFQVVGYTRSKVGQPAGNRLIIWHVPTTALH